MNMNDEEIEDGVFEEIPECEVILSKDLSEEDLKKIADSETAEVSPEDAAAFAKELEDASKQIDANTKRGSLHHVLDTNTERSLTQHEMLAAIKNATSEGILDKSHKVKLLREMGIFKSTFTKKIPSKPANAKKRKAAKKARRKNRK